MGEKDKKEENNDKNTGTGKLKKKQEATGDIGRRQEVIRENKDGQMIKVRR